MKYFLIGFACGAASIIAIVFLFLLLFTNMIHDWNTYL